jgi:hypothetical protein
MLAYANEIRRQRHINYNNNNVDNNNVDNNNVDNNNVDNNNVDNDYISINIENLPFYDYEVLSELPVIKVGLISKKLFDKSKIESSKDTSFCTICQQDIFLDIVRILNCSHTYHVNCIDKWFIENKKCPQCRYEI